MSKPNGRHRKRNIERLAEALQDCFDEAAETGREQSEQRIRETVREETAGVKETLRMIWRQCGGKQDEHLPIDD